MFVLLCYFVAVLIIVIYLLILINTININVIVIDLVLVFRTLARIAVVLIILFDVCCYLVFYWFICFTVFI